MNKEKMKKKERNLLDKRNNLNTEICNRMQGGSKQTNDVFIFRVSMILHSSL